MEKYPREVDFGIFFILLNVLCSAPGISSLVLAMSFLLLLAQSSALSLTALSLVLKRGDRWRGELSSFSVQILYTILQENLLSVKGLVLFAP